MKKILFLATALLCTLGTFTSCSDDNDSNPTLIQPTEFTLNTPAYAAYDLVLADSKLDLTWSQPQFTADNAPVNATYQIQVSTTGTFTTSFAEAAADESGELVADYVTLGETTQKCNITIAGATLAKALQQLNNWAEDAVPAKVTTYVRVDASVQDRNHVASNVVPLSFVPYYVELVAADPQFWFLVGNGAVGNWTNGADDMGNTTIPLSLVDGATYDEQTGEGEFTYTGYFEADQFKLVLTPGQWAPMWGASSEGLDGNPIYRATEADTDPACWKPATAGYYTVTFNSTGGTGSTKISVAAYEGDAPKKFSSMEIIGAFNDWKDDGVVTMTANAVNPHVWYADLKLTADTELKFRAESAWSDNWGGDAFPYAIANGGGANINVPAGNYRVVFNDINKCYYFFTVE